MRKVRLRLKNEFHLDAVSTHRAAPGKGSIADLEIMDLQGLIRNNLSDRDPRWQKPIRNRAQYLEFKCPRPKRNIKEAGDCAGILSLGHAATRQPAQRVSDGKPTSTLNGVGKEARADDSGFGLW